MKWNIRMICYSVQTIVVIRLVILTRFRFLKNKDCFMKDEQKKEYDAPKMRVHELDCKSNLLQGSNATEVSGPFD